MFVVVLSVLCWWEHSVTRTKEEKKTGLAAAGVVVVGVAAVVGLVVKRLCC